MEIKNNEDLGKMITATQEANITAVSIRTVFEKKIQKKSRYYAYILTKDKVEKKIEGMETLSRMPDNFIKIFIQGIRKEEVNIIKENFERITKITEGISKSTKKGNVNLIIGMEKVFAESLTSFGVVIGPNMKNYKVYKARSKKEIIEEKKKIQKYFYLW